MRRQIDLRSGRMMLALGAVGLGGGCTSAAALPASAQARAAGGSDRSPARVGSGSDRSPARVGSGSDRSPARAGSGSDRSPARVGSDSDWSQAHAAGGRERSTSQTDAARRAVVLTDSVGAAAAAVAPASVPGVEPVVSATETTRNVLIGGSLSVRGAVLPLTATDRAVALQEHRGNRWLTVARAHTHRLGRYRLHFKPDAPGTVKLRVLDSGVDARRTVGSINIYRQAFASWYGGGGQMACGGTLTNSTLGVASKTLPCGTIVGLRLGRRAIRVPVVDRGPYVAGREFDLTPATKRALGFGDLGMIWVT